MSLTKKQQAKTRVVFRAWPITGKIVALFPEIPGRLSGTCEAFAEYGPVNSGAHYYNYMLKTRKALPSEYAAMFDQLTKLGFNLRPIVKSQPYHHQRREAARELL